MKGWRHLGFQGSQSDTEYVCHGDQNCKDQVGCPGMHVIKGRLYNCVAGRGEKISSEEDSPGGADMCGVFHNFREKHIGSATHQQLGRNLKGVMRQGFLVCQHGRRCSDGDK